MSNHHHVKLGKLLDLAFEIPDIGVVNVHLLFEILRALIARLGLNDYDVLVDLGSSSSKALTEGLVQDELSEVKRWDSRSAACFLSPSLMAMDPEQRAAEIAQRRAEDTRQVLSLLKAYLVRLRALEAGLSDLRAKREEDLERMAKMQQQIDRLESKLCEQEQKLAKLASDLDCLALAMLDYDIKIEDLNRRFDLTDTQIRQIRCEIRCIEKDRQEFADAVRMVTEQINHFSVTKADKRVMEEELALRALASDLNNYVPCECYNLVQVELSRNIGCLHDDIYKLEQYMKQKARECEKGLHSKVELVEMEALRKQQSKILTKLRQMEMQRDPKYRAPTVAAGVILKDTGSAHCVACSFEASLEGNHVLIPKPVPFIPPTKKKEIFTLQSRYCGGNATIVKPEERVIIPGPVLDLDCTRKNTQQIKQIVGDDGSAYLADLDCPVKKF